MFNFLFKNNFSSLRKDLNFHVTLWPSFPHFKDFAYNNFVSSIRLNSAMIHSADLDKELSILDKIKPTVPLYFDIKGRQLRVKEAIINPTHLELIVNHPIECDTPVVVLFKAGEDRCVLSEIKDGGTRLVFDGGPKYIVKNGESLHIRDSSFKVLGDPILDYEIEKIKKVLDFGIKNYYLSYVEDQYEVDFLRKIIGNDCNLILKIETKKGVDYLRTKYKKDNKTKIMAARGDLYVELDKPHEILNLTKEIIKIDNSAYIGSRLLLSVVKSPVPDCVDFSELAWLYDLGYRNFLFCDELCLKGHLLSVALNVFKAFKDNYIQQ